MKTCWSLPCRPWSIIRLWYQIHSGVWYQHVKGLHFCGAERRVSISCSCWMLLQCRVNRLFEAVQQEIPTRAKTYRLGKPCHYHAHLVCFRHTEPDPQLELRGHAVEKENENNIKAQLREQDMICTKPSAARTFSAQLCAIAITLSCSEAHPFSRK